MAGLNYRFTKLIPVKLTRGLYRKGTWLELRADTVVTVAVQLPEVGLSLRLVGEPTEAVHQGELGGADVGLVALLGGDPVDLAHGRVGVQVAVNYRHPSYIHGNLAVLQGLVVAHWPV